MEKRVVSQNVITPEATLSYPALFEPKGFGDNPPKYSCVLVFDAGTDLTPLKKAAIEAGKAFFGDKFEALYRAGKLRMPFRQEDTPDKYPAGSIYLNVSSKTAPGIVSRYPGPDGKPMKITDPEVMYPGCRVRASVRFFGYDKAGNKGVSVALCNIQRMGDGKRIDGRKSAEDEFEADLEAPDEFSQQGSVNRNDDLGDLL